MKRKRFTDEQIIGVLKEHEAGCRVSELARRHGVAENTIYRWKSKFGGMEVSEAKRLRDLEAENAKLKRLYADAMRDNAALKDGRVKKVVTPATRRHVAGYIRTTHGLSQRRACGLVGLSRSVARYRTRRTDDVERRNRLKELARRYPRYGYLMLHGLLAAEGRVVNRKRTYRLYREAGLQVRTKRRKKLTRPRVALAVPEAANTRWSLDCVGDQLASGRRFRVLNIVDDYSRECVGQLVDTSISGDRLVRYLDSLAAARKLPATIVCDNGPELTSKAMFVGAERTGVTLHFSQPGKPTQNAFVASFNDKFRDTGLNLHGFDSLAYARQLIDTWRHHYNHERPHSALGYKPPAPFAEPAA